MRTLIWAIVCVLFVGTAAAQDVEMADLSMSDGLVVVTSTGTPLTGNMVHRHGDGSMASSEGYVDGRRHGMEREWDPDGTLRLEAAWVEGRRHGAQKLFDHDGQMLLSAEWKEGVREGATVWYYPSGQVMWETHFAAGAEHGKWSQFGPDGELYIEAWYENGEKVRRRNARGG